MSGRIRTLSRTALARRAAGATVALLLAVGCSSSDATSESGGLVVVTSSNVYADIATTVGGGRVDVTAFLDSPGQDPHSYQATTRDVLNVTDADVVMENGGGYDDFMDTLLDRTDGAATVLNAVDISGVAPPTGGELNEHVWYDLPSMQKVALATAGALGDVDPKHTAAYSRNAKRFNAGLQRQIDREARLKHTFAGLAVAVTEPVPGHMLSALGLQDLTPASFSQAVEEGEDVSVAVLDETLRLFSDSEVDALVYNVQTTGATTEQVIQAAEDSGIAVVGVTETLPDGESYLTWMTSTLDELVRALRHGG